MHLLRKRQNEFLLSLVAGASPLPFVRQIFELFLSGVATGQQKEEHDFGKWLLSSWCLVCFFAELRDGVPSEGNALHGIKCTTIVEHDGQTSHTQHGVVDLDLSDNFLAVLFSKLGQLCINKTDYFICAGG